MCQGSQILTVVSSPSVQRMMQCWCTAFVLLEVKGKYELPAVPADLLTFRVGWPPSDTHFSVIFTSQNLFFNFRVSMNKHNWLFDSEV